MKGGGWKGVWGGGGWAGSLQRAGQVASRPQLLLQLLPSRPCTLSGGGRRAAICFERRALMWGITVQLQSVCALVSCGVSVCVSMHAKLACAGSSRSEQPRQHNQCTACTYLPQCHQRGPCQPITNHNAGAQSYRWCCSHPLWVGMPHPPHTNMLIHVYIHSAYTTYMLEAFARGVISTGAAADTLVALHTHGTLSQRVPPPLLLPNIIQKRIRRRHRHSGKTGPGAACRSSSSSGLLWAGQVQVWLQGGSIRGLRACMHVCVHACRAAREPCAMNSTRPQPVLQAAAGKGRARPGTRRRSSNPSKKNPLPGCEQDWPQGSAQLALHSAHTARPRRCAQPLPPPSLVCAHGGTTPVPSSV